MHKVPKRIWPQKKEKKKKNKKKGKKKDTLKNDLRQTYQFDLQINQT